MKWNLDALAAAPEETRGLNTPADGIYELSAFHAVPDKWRFSPMGDCGQVPFRGGVVRFVFFKLFGTGIVALLCAARAADRKASFGCALSAAVNAVACFHYALIWSARMQIFPRSLRQFEAPIGNPIGDAKDDNKRIGLQDFFVVRFVPMMPPFVRLPFDRACARDRRTAGAFRTGQSHYPLCNWSSGCWHLMPTQRTRPPRSSRRSTATGARRCSRS
jgi:hypothetical protein